MLCSPNSGATKWFGKNKAWMLDKLKMAKKKYIEDDKLSMLSGRNAVWMHSAEYAIL